MTATIVPAERLEQKRKERERRKAFVGSILSPLDDQDSPAPASPARKETQHDPIQDASDPAPIRAS